MRVSPSQVHTYDLCRRKWAYKTIEGRQEPTSAAQAEGTEGHARIERHLRTGEHPGTDALGRLIDAARRPGALPLPSPHLLLEHEFSIPLAGGHAFYGFIDCIVPPGDDGIATVIDHKFVGGLKWAKDEAALRADPQAIGYGKAAALLYPAARVIERRWLYLQKKSTRVMPVGFAQPRAEVEAAWAPLERQAMEMLALRARRVAAEELEGSADACASFGGCPFKPICSVGSRAGMFAKKAIAYNATNGKGEEAAYAQGGAATMGLLDQLNKLKATADNAPAQAQEAPAPAQAQAAPAPAQAPLPGMARGKGALAALQAAKGARGVNPPEGAAPSAKGAIDAAHAAEATARAASPKTLNLKPHEPGDIAAAKGAIDAPAAQREVDEAFARVEAAEKRAAAARALADKLDVEAAHAATRAAAPSASAPAYSSEQEPAPPKAAKEEKPHRVKPKAPPAQPAGAARSQLTVIFNAAIVKRPADNAEPVHLVDLIAPIMRDVADKGGKAHWLLIPYNEGKALLAHAVDEWLATSGWKGVVYVDAVSEEAKAVREVLLAHADVVVRGLA